MWPSPGRRSIFFCGKYPTPHSATVRNLAAFLCRQRTLAPILSATTHCYRRPRSFHTSNYTRSDISLRIAELNKRRTFSSLQYAIRN